MNLRHEKLLKWAKKRQQGWEKKVLFDGDVEVVEYESQFLSSKEWGIQYLPVYNACPCVIRTLVFDLFFLKKRISRQTPRIKTSIFPFN